jgi:predicted membrane protein
MRYRTRFLIVIVILLVMGIITVAIGYLVLAAVDFVGVGLFFLLWVRQRRDEPPEGLD